MTRNRAIQIIFAGLAILVVSTLAADGISDALYHPWPPATGPDWARLASEFFSDGWAQSVGALVALMGAYFLVAAPNNPS